MSNGLVDYTLTIRGLTYEQAKNIAEGEFGAMVWQDGKAYPSSSDKPCEIAAALSGPEGMPEDKELPNEVWVVLSRDDGVSYSTAFAADHRYAAMEHALEMSEDLEAVKMFGPFRVERYVRAHALRRDEVVADPALSMGKLFPKLDKEDFDTINWMLRSARSVGKLDAAIDAARRG